MYDRIRFYDCYINVPWDWRDIIRKGLNNIDNILLEYDVSSFIIFKLKEKFGYLIYDCQCVLRNKNDLIWYDKIVQEFRQMKDEIKKLKEI